MSHTERDPRQNPLRDWLKQNYYIPKYGVDYQGEAPTKFAKALLGIGGLGENEGYFIALRGILAEIVFQAVLRQLSPAECSIEMATKKQDSAGCDFVIKDSQGQAIGGIDLTSSPDYLWRKRRRAQIVTVSHEFPVVHLFADDLGSHQLMNVLKRGEIPNITDFVETRMAEGKNMHGFRSLDRAITRAFPQLPSEGQFSGYLVSLQTNVRNHISS